jgi:hypothetical protein
VYAGTRAGALTPRNHVDARIPFVVTGRTDGAYVFDMKAATLEAAAYELGTGLVGVSGRIDGGEANQRAGQVDELFAPTLDGLEHLFYGIYKHLRRPVS